MKQLIAKLLIASGDISNFNLTFDSPLIPKLPGSIWRVGVSPWERLRPECLEPSLKCHPGIELEILAVIATLLNATIAFKTSEYPGCGYKDKNNRWVGLFGMLEAGEIDLIGNLCTVDEWRLQENFTKASKPVLRYRQSFLVKIPEPVFQYSMWAPFQEIVWCVLSIFGALYFTLHSILLHNLHNVHCKKSIYEAFLETMQSATGMNFNIDRYPLTWLVWLIYAGFFTSLYSNYIKAALMTPVTVQRPFSNTLQLADKLLSGEYKLLDYHENIAYPKCYPSTTCQLLMNAVAKHGYVKRIIKEIPSGTNLLMDELLTHENLVYVKGRYWMDTYIDSYPERKKLWVMDDEYAAEQWSAYFMHKDFQLITIFDRILGIVGDYKLNLHSRYLGLSDMVYKKTFVKGSIPEKSVVEFSMFYGPISVYLCGGAISLVVFGIEYYKRPNRVYFN